MKNFIYFLLAPLALVLIGFLLAAIILFSPFIFVIVFYIIVKHENRKDKKAHRGFEAINNRKSSKARTPG